MSSIASPRRTERPLLSDRWAVARLATLVATLIFSAILLTFRPFMSLDPTADGGDIVNQLGFGLLGALALCSMAMLADRRRAVAMFSPWWALLVAFAALSVLTAPEAGQMLRSFAFTLVGILAMACLLALPRDEEGFSAVFATGAVLLLGLSYAGVLLLPAQAIHGTIGPEPEHLGMWRGVYSHKNIAGPVMACVGFIGVYLLRGGRFWFGLAVAVAATVFVWNTGSKTAAGLIPITAIAVLLPRVLGLWRLAPAMMLAALIAAAILTVGLVLFAPLGRLAADLTPGMTYTGRLAIWDYTIEMIARQPLTGYGYESFWGEVPRIASDPRFGSDWDVRGAAHAHNGYLDIALAMGLPALAAAVVALVLVPMRDYVRTLPTRANHLLADLFLMIVAYTLFNAMMESFFFRRADPVWLLFVLGALGLRLTARFPLSPQNRRA